MKTKKTYFRFTLPFKKRAGSIYIAHFDNIRRAAFTLAEVLITIGIIGVVAAITMPTLISNHQEKETVTKLQTIYSQLSQATLNMINDQNGGLDNIWGEYPVDTYMELLQQYIKVTEGKYIPGRCCAYLFNQGQGGISGGSKIWILPSGAEIAYTKGNKIGSTYLRCDMYTNYLKKDGNKGTTYFDTCGGFWVDLNGFNNRPNIFGKDVFQFSLLLDGILPAGMPQEGVWTGKFDECIKKGLNCTAWIIINKNMDYLRCPDKVGWETQSSCK